MSGETGGRLSGEYAVVGDWLVESTGGCTCGAGEGIYGHEPGCGQEPIARVSELLDQAAALARVEALADEWADDTGIEGYINLGEVESRLRRALHPDPSDA